MKHYKIILLFLFSSLSWSQVKNEHEERIPKSDFPLVAQNYFDSFMDDVKYLKFYKETDGSKHSFEAKFRLNDLHFSVEFDSIGKLEDIEIVIKKRHISKIALNAINTYFLNNYKRTRFVKIQKQYVNYTNQPDLHFIEHIAENPFDKHTHYEIIAEVKTEGGRVLKEFTFTNRGQFEKMRIVTSSSYEHALY